MFKQAERKQTKLRMSLDGPAGSGKTYTALRFAHTLAQGGRIAVIDTERGSASKYAGENPDGTAWNFDVMELYVFNPEKYIDGISAAARAGYSVLIIDSLSHAWEGVGGVLEMKMKAGEGWSSWRTVTPVHNRLVDAILQSPMHVITTMRSRMEYVQEQDPVTNKTVIRKIGLSPVQRPGMEYEFDIVADLEWSHILTISKTRCRAVDGQVVDHPGPGFMQQVVEWLNSGAAAAPVFQPAASDPIPAPGTENLITLDELVSIYGAEAVMAANSGLIPATQDDLNNVLSKLIGVAE